tara:strand:+ start:1652 stop:4465 length:2814 start_codon:yes stop_codon:yes gene_type:complete
VLGDIVETRTFLKKVLGQDGHYCVFAFRTRDDKRIQKFYSSVDHVVDVAVNLDKEGYDAYFALATFKEAGSRKVDNVKELNSFFLDLDCGLSKDYKTQEQAIEALKSFCMKFKLPRPTMINSGRGVHVYWFLTEPVGMDNWLPVAERLKRLCAQNNLLADPAVTADGARVLRIPNTHNHKTDPPSKVGLFGNDITEAIHINYFAELLGEDVMQVPQKRNQQNNPVLDALKNNIESVFKDILIKTQKGKGCGQLKHIMVNQGEISEPLWRAGLSITKHCVDGDKASHIISNKHPEYTQEQTIRKMETIKGPYLCSTFDEYSPDICTSCPNWGKIKSPITLGHRIREATEEDNMVEAPAFDLPDTPLNKYKIPMYPKPYFRGVNGGVYIRSTNADGEADDKLVYHNDLYVVRRLRDVEIGEAVVMRLHLPRDGVREFTLPLTAVTSREEFRKHMSMQGVAVTRMDELMAYTTTWVNELQSNSMADEAHRQFGWSNEECKSFVVGNQEIFKDKVDFNPPSTQTAGLFTAFEPRGSMEGWKEAINFYNRDGFELHQFVVGTSFGSPLMQFSPINCAGLHIYSKESGVGKTTAMAAAASIWGRPEDLIIHERDTFNTKMNRGEVYHNLPLYMDELTNTHGRELSNIAYQLTGGRQRGRMSSGTNTERHRGESWRLLAVTTGNTSMIERISIIKAMPKAEAQRIMECRVKRIQFETKEETDVFSSAIQDNCGHAGKEYIQYVMRNLDGVKKLLADVQAKVDAEAGLTAENRFWSVLVSHTVTGLIIAKKAGLLNYDSRAIFKWSVNQLKENKRHVDDMSTSVEEILNDYIHEHWSNVLWIKSTDDLRKQTDKEQVIIPEALPRGKLVARYETDLKRAYLVPKPLKVWCGDQQINYNSFVHDLQHKLGARKSKMRLSKGTHMNLPPTHVIIVDCSIEKEEEFGT